MYNIISSINSFQFYLDELIGFQINSGRGLVEHQHLGFAKQCSAINRLNKNKLLVKVFYI